jgi:hypothetical protein
MKKNFKAGINGLKGIGSSFRCFLKGLLGSFFEWNGPSSSEWENSNTSFGMCPRPCNEALD